MKIFSQIIEILLLGIIGGAVPGPILTAVFTEVLNRGFKWSFFVMLKALLAESLVAGLILLGFFTWNVPTEYFYIMSFGGAIVLFWIAKQVWGIEKLASDKMEVFSFLKLLLLTVLNGAFWIFWITICVPRAFELRQAIFGGHVLFLLLFEMSWLITVLVLAYVFSKFRPLLLKRNLISTVFKTFAMLLVFFGLKSIWGGAIYFLTST